MHYGAVRACASHETHCISGNLKQLCGGDTSCGA